MTTVEHSKDTEGELKLQKTGEVTLPRETLAAFGGDELAVDEIFA